MEILFKKGIPGFQECKSFKLKEIEDMEPFNLLQSVENEELGLVLISPFEVEKNYEIKLSDELLKELEIKSPEEVCLFTTVTLNSDVEKITTNLRAPIVVNIKNGYGEQIIIENDKYKIKHPIINKG